MLEDETHDPSKEPGMTDHYVGHAVFLGRFCDEKDEYRKELKEKLGRCYEEDSKDYQLLKRTLGLLDDGWKTREDVESFFEKYEQLRKDIENY